MWATASSYLGCTRGEDYYSFNIISNSMRNVSWDPHQILQVAHRIDCDRNTGDLFFWRFGGKLEGGAYFSF
jgi:hypothetical protein